MELRVFSIRDAKTEVFHQPWYATTHGEAERHFKTVANEKESKINQYPEDYDLYYLGRYDDNTGKFQPLDTPEHVVKAVQLVKPKSENVLHQNA